ncbi:MAG TPA: hypothetical protein VNB64_08775 [Solirubrobacteraceae bacterium]|nr:hypothetical protein [Solirubrobacteraceae bacterium]
MSTREATEDGGREPAPPALRRMRIAMVAGLGGLILLLAVFGYFLVDAQRQERQDVEHRFRDVAQVSAALTEGLFDVSRGSSAQQARTQFGGPRIDQALLDAQALRARQPYIEIYDARGRRLAASSGAPRDAAPGPAVRIALRTGRSQLPDVVGRGPEAVTEWAIPFRGAAGPRVQVSGISLKVLGAFLAGFLGRVPNFADAESEVVDSRGVVLGGANLRTPLGRPLGDRELLGALGDRGHGSYGDDRWFAASPIAGSSWKVVLSTSQDDLYGSISAERRWVPWLLFVAFALAALTGLVMMRRSALAAAELQRKQLSERHAVEINDNIIQGLALASYELERGERMAGSSQVAETLREAQRLVSQLLGQGEIQPGQLRREMAARTDPPGSREDVPPAEPPAEGKS